MNSSIRPVLPNVGPPVGSYKPANPPLPGEIRMVPAFGSYIPKETHQ